MRPGLIAIININISTTACEVLRSPHAIIATTNTAVFSCSRNLRNKKNNNNQTTLQS